MSWAWFWYLVFYFQPSLEGISREVSLGCRFRFPLPTFPDNISTLFLYAFLLHLVLVRIGRVLFFWIGFGMNRERVYGCYFFFLVVRSICGSFTSE
jgi:hypothetical protein